MGVQMSRTCDIIILNMFEVEQLCRVYKVGDGRVFVECDECWGVELGSLHKTVRGEVRVFAGDGVVKSRTGWGERLCASGLGSGIGVGGGNDGGKRVRWEAVVSKK